MMTRWLLALALLAGASRAAHGQAPLGPGAGGATLKQPWETTAPAARPAPVPAGPLQGLWNQAAVGAPKSLSGLPGLQELEKPVPEVNQDIAIKKEHGSWVISIIAYIGPDAPKQSRKMVSELRDKYKLPAYVFNYGAEERRKEYERIKEQVDKQRELLEKTKQEMGQQAYQVSPIPIKRAMHLQDNCAVVVPYADEAAARRALEQVRRLDPKLLDRSLLDMKFYGRDNPMTNKIERGEYVYVDPFPRAFVAPNPAVKRERQAGFNQQDLATLRKLNDGQPYNLMQCPKRYTLAIKQFVMPSGLQTPSESKAATILDPLKLAKDTPDHAAENAHTLAKVLRQLKLDAYVLHTRFASIVTVGSFESLDDPALRSMQNVLLTQLKPRLDARLELFPQPLPMEVPH